jgi:ribosomal protein S24E
MLEQALACSVVGSAETVRHGLEEFIRETGADELMVTSQIFDHEARLRSFEITSAVRRYGVEGSLPAPSRQEKRERERKNVSGTSP